MKAYLGHDGKVITYGLDGEKARNYVKYGLYVGNNDPRLQPHRRWWTWLRAPFR